MALFITKPKNSSLYLFSMLDILELYNEVDKLWASAWRKNKANISTNKNLVATNAKKLISYKKLLDGQLAVSTSDKKKITADIDRLNKLAKSISQMSQNQTYLEKLADQFNKLNLDSEQLKKRVTTNEEWVDSINGFRKQVNRNINNLQQSVGQLQQRVPPPP